MSKHTPGPWYAVSCRGGKFYRIRNVNAKPTDSPGTTICQLTQHQVDWREMEANAQLLAVAPDLLDALDSALNYINGYGKTTKAQIIVELERIRRKARGEE